MRGSPSLLSTLTGPIFSDMPHRPTIWRAIAVAISRSLSTPVVVAPNTSDSAARPPSAPMIRPRR